MEVLAGDLAEKDGPAIAEEGGEAAKLMARVGGCDGFGTLRDDIAGEDREALGATKEGGVESEIGSQVIVECDEGGGDDGRGFGLFKEAFGELGVGVFERELHTGSV